MGGNSSKVEEITQTLNSIEMDVMTKYSEGASASESENQNLVISNAKGGSIKGLEMDEVMSVDFSVMENASINEEVESELTDKLSSALKQVTMDMELSVGSENEVANKSLVQNIIKQKMSVEVMQTMDLQMSENQNVTLEGNTDLSVQNIKLSEKADAIVKLISGVSSEIVSAVIGKTENTSQTSTEEKSTLAESITAFGNAMNNILQGWATVFGIDTSTMIIFGLIAIVSIIAGVMVMRKKGPDDYKEADETDPDDPDSSKKEEKQNVEQSEQSTITNKLKQEANNTYNKYKSAIPSSVTSKLKIPKLSL